MGLILDSSVLIAAERKGKNARKALEEIAVQAPGEEVALSVITLVELAHGIARADTAQRRSMRQQFVHELISAIPVHPVGTSIALRAGRIDGENVARGLHLALSDLLIGVTALELGFGVATGNIRHFQMVPGLHIVSF
jgi:predicted nucleic acid-binding protein